MKKLRHAGVTILAALREIFDESAYGRFLQRSGQAPCRASYREFLLERQSAKAPPRCC
jgi:hypothetical protein